MRPRALRRLRAAMLAALAAAGVLWALSGGPAHGGEFITPPGLNVEGQEAVLREQVTRIAQSLVGDQLVDVVVSVRYVRTDGTQGRRIKLPGLNSYIASSAGGGDIVAGHVRVRQILVMVSDKVPSEPEALAQELRQQGRLDPTQGDLVRVVKINAREAAAQAAAGAKGTGGKGADGGLAEDARQLSRRLQQQQDKQREENVSQELGKMIAQGSLAEAQATTFLIKARQAYFNGDYDRALDQILQSIAQNPNNPQAYAMLGSLYYAVDWKQLALKYWEKSLTLDPQNREIQELVTKLRASPSPGQAEAR